MTQQKSFIQKIVYLVVVCVLLVPLYLLGHPAKVEMKAGQQVLDRGGKLAQIRDDEGLTESNIGRIDPAGSTVKLATFGLRGVAIALLWHRCQEYEKKKDWSNVIATAYQLTTLEPHFTTIWEFQGWKLAYNASAEFDDYRERYRWVIRGINFLTQGVEFNRQAPKLCKATGWTISQKIGIADENQQYRRLLREDEEFGERHNCKLPYERDNWMLGRRWYAMGEDLVTKGVSIGKESDFLFFSHARLNLFNYAMWMRKDGCGYSGSEPIFGRQAIAAWQTALREWLEFGKMELSTAIPKDGSMNMAPGVPAHRTTLQTAELIQAKEKELLDELKGLVPGLYERLHVDRWKKLAETPAEQAVLLDRLQNAEQGEDEEYKILRPWLDKNEPNWQERLRTELDKLYPEEVVELKKIPSLLWEENERDIVNKTEGEVGQVRNRTTEMLKVGPKVLMQEIQEADVPREQKQRARSIVQEIDSQEFMIGLRMSNLYRDILNYKFRVREVAVEETNETDDARRLRHEGRVAYYDGRLKDSIRLWIEAMAAWDKLFHKPGFEDIPQDAQFIREIIDIVEKFVILLDNDNSIFPDDVPMQVMIWAKVNQENNPQQALDALDYAKKEFERGEYEAAEKHITIVLYRLDGLNRAIEFMKLAPLPEVRDRMIEAFALYVECLRKQNAPLPSATPPVPLKTFVELMLQHDPLLDKAVVAVQPGIPLLRERKGAEAQAEFDKAMELWQQLLTKYPFIYLDRQHPAYTDASMFAAAYAESLKLQEKTVPDDSILSPFLPQ